MKRISLLVTDGGRNKLNRYCNLIPKLKTPETKWELCGNHECRGRGKNYHSEYLE